jgi:CheY-like chemotaxis protein
MDRNSVVNILLIEDNPDHAEMTLRALKNGTMIDEVFWVQDGAEALDFLYRRGRYAHPMSAPQPGLILLDIKLPKVDGHEVLRAIKNDENLRTIPVVMLTTSGRSDDVNRSYRTGANGFVTKPVNFRDFVETIKTVKRYWVLTNVLGAA